MSATHLSIVTQFFISVISVFLISQNSFAQRSGGVVKASDINALRANVNAKLVGCSQPVVTFTDTPLGSGMSVKAIHLTELRAAVTGLYTSQGYQGPNYTDPVITAKNTPIKAIHFSELQGFITASSCAPSPSCPIASLSWTVGPDVCSASFPVTSSGGSASGTDSTGPTRGSATFSCIAGAWNASPVPGATCAPSCSGVSPLGLARSCCGSPVGLGLCCAVNPFGSPSPPTWYPRPGSPGPGNFIYQCGCGNSPVYFVGPLNGC